MINLNHITSNSKTIKSHYTKVMYFAQHNLLLYGKLESSYQYVVQIVMDMLDKYEQFLEVSLCQYELHVNNILCKFLLVLGFLTLLYLVLLFERNIYQSTSVMYHLVEYFFIELWWQLQSKNNRIVHKL